MSATRLPANQLAAWADGMLLRLGVWGFGGTVPVRSDVFSFSLSDGRNSVNAFNFLLGGFPGRLTSANRLKGLGRPTACFITRQITPSQVPTMSPIIRTQINPRLPPLQMMKTARMTSAGIKNAFPLT